MFSPGKQCIWPSGKNKLLDGLHIKLKLTPHCAYLLQHLSEQLLPTHPGHETP